MRIPFISNMIQNKANALFQEYVSDYFKDMKDQKQKDREVYKNSSIGEPIIIIPDHTGSIVLGIITGWHYDDNGVTDIPIVYDAVNDNTLFCMAQYITYSEQRFETLYKLEPDDRFAIMYTNCTANKGEAYITKNEGTWLDIEDTRSLAKKNGFYEKAKSYWSQL